MAILSLQLHHPRFTLVEDNDALVGKIWFEGVFTGDELSVKDGDGSEYPATAIVTFAASGEADATGTLTYSERWHDDAEGVTYPGSCQLALPAKQELWALLQQSNKDAYEVHLMVECKGNTSAIYFMGPDDGGEYHWDPKVRNPLPARVKSIGLVPATQDPPDAVSKVAEVDQTQVALASLLDAIKSAHTSQTSALQELALELRRVRLFLIVGTVLCIGYAVAKAI